MATYESLLPDIIPMVQNCPDSLIESNIRSAVIELCEKAGVYQAELDPITTVSGIYEYDLEPPTDTAVHKIMWVLYNGDALEPISTTLLEERKPKWREASYHSTPEYYVKQSRSLFYLVPVPNETTANSTRLRVQLKPLHTSTSCNDDIMDDYREAIVNGTLFRLLRMPSRDWTDFQGADVYRSLYNVGLVEAERRAQQSDTGVARKVRYGGPFLPLNRRRNRYGREIR
tara:strand:+ start:981 stop:1667 length:687 start_codon:yes stop_codon:yes gene_type:complete